MLCGHYEGFDERVRRHLATDEISIGDYVLTGGELPALVIVDAVTRLLPGVLGNDESAQADTFTDDLLEYPHYTRPPDSGAGVFPTFCSPATTPRSPSGDARSSSAARASVGPTSGRNLSRPSPTRSC